MAQAPQKDTTPKTEAKFDLGALVSTVEDSTEATARVHAHSAKATSPFKPVLAESWAKGTEPNLGSAKRVVIGDNEDQIKAVLASLRAAADGLNVDGHDPKLGVSIQVRRGVPEVGKTTIVFAAKLKRSNNVTGK